MQWPLLIACFSSKLWLVASASQELRPPACTLAAMLGHVGVGTSENEPTRRMPQFLASLQVHCETSGKWVDWEDHTFSGKLEKQPLTAPRLVAKLFRDHKRKELLSPRIGFFQGPEAFVTSQTWFVFQFFWPEEWSL